MASVERERQRPYRPLPRAAGQGPPRRIVAQGGDVVCAADDAIFINSRVVAERLVRDRLGRPLPNWSGCHLLDSGGAFLLMVGRADSFDSRYFGPIPTAAIIGRLVPLWIE